ncbi:hypothetical protein BDQ12DRAFT_146541 [Crucibulum laeve]|uniref:CsbD-like domain-containing protein n=1 Tax=Crucibulum laeve TaxID=68775 RepID=A0A5C3LWJ0_9AGAR|nr:hypothetical protein BDQ12DRAFT_146541 [Crucibulum laeve]
MDSTNNTIPDTRPSHHIHNTSDPLPGTKGASPTVDYSAETLEHSKLPPNTTTTGTDHHQHHHTGAPAQGKWTGSSATREEFANTEFDSKTTPFTERYELGDAAKGDNHEFGAERPMHSQSKPQGTGISVGDEHPERKAGFGDKLIGKTQKVIGKMSHKPEMQEKGELRATAGKEAVQNDARLN